MSDEPTRLDAPNQQVVRADGSGPADEGGGGTAAPDNGNGGTELEAMTKDELLALAEERGVEANASMTKAEIKEAIEAG
jgi:hypothetical protein